MFGQSEVVRVIGSRQSKSPGDLDGTEVESGIGVEPDWEPQGHVEGFGKGVGAQLTVPLILIEGI